MANKNATGYISRYDYLTGMVFDRTAQDVANKTDKGYWNISDVNRIENAIKTMSDYLGLGLTTKTWILGDSVTLSDYNLIYNNINAIKSVWHSADDTPSIPTANYFSYEKANDLEKILSDFLDFKISKETDKTYSGQVYSGGERNI